MYSHKGKTLRDYARGIKCAIYDNTLLYLRSQLATHADCFLCGGVEYEYARLRTNAAYSSERVIELPIVVALVNDCIANEGKVLEVGNVLNHYYPFEHTVVDKYEKSQAVINEDIVNFVANAQYDLTVSISTLEHVGYDEEKKDPTKVINALKRMTQATKKGGKIVITVPLGYNLSLDEDIRSGRIQPTRMHLLKRVSCENEWEEIPLGLLQTENFTYGEPYPYANWVLIMSIDVV